MRLFFVFSILLLGFSCFAYDIEPYSKQTPYKLDNTLNLVFYSLNYQNNEDFIKDIEALTQKLKKTRPFDEFNNLRFWYIVLSKQGEDEIFKPTQDFPPLKVRQDFLEGILSKLKSNYKLVIINTSGSVSCAELSLANKTSLVIMGKNRYKNSSSFAKGFLHELGHSLGLRDECIKCAQLSSAGPPNCATTEEEAKEWWGDLMSKDSRVRYVNGCCGNKDYIRPTIASLMNDPEKAEDFGPVNERFLRKELGIE